LRHLFPVRRFQAATRSSLRDLQHYQTLYYVLILLRCHRPGFDDLPSKARANLVADTCARTNAFLEALRKLVTFLEHGRLNYLDRPPARWQAGTSRRLA
jgi:hypothetical protein